MIGDGAARVVLALALGPFLWFALRDLRLHLRARRVPRLEDALHLLLGLLLAGVLARAFRFDTRGAAFALLAFVVLGAVDEYVFHDRSLPPEEHDVHAKEHLALLLFVAVFGAVVQLR